ncbi:barrier-to-autointegration factor B [Octopus sinensis]|nr:barrier-to-autointegration factor B [Octopus sinensis]
MSTSQKFRNFVDEPMGDKSVKQLAGIGDTLGDRLIEKGYEKAYNVLGQFLLLNKDEELFKDWISETINANAKQGRDCFNCLKTWCDNYL